jgi:hypothetical protein
MNKKFFAALAVFTMLFYSVGAMAATTTPTGYTGSDALQTVENIIYGPWGLLIGIVLFFAAIMAWLKFGAGTGVVVAAFAVLIFVVPALISQAQQWGASHAGYTQNNGSNGNGA